MPPSSRRLSSAQDAPGGTVTFSKSGRMFLPEPTLACRVAASKTPFQYQFLPNRANIGRFLAAMTRTRRRRRTERRMTKPDLRAYRGSERDACPGPLMHDGALRGEC